MSKLTVYIIAGLLASGAATAFYQAVKFSGVKQERVRVEKKALKTDAKAQTARAAAVAQPDRVLGRYYRD
jgi:hypothetical protein